MTADLYTVLRNTADRVPLFFILSLTALDFFLYFTVENFWVLFIYFVAMIIPKGCICAWNHHHQHTKTFNKTPWNRLLELAYASVSYTHLTLPTNREV